MVREPLSSTYVRDLLHVFYDKLEMVKDSLGEELDDSRLSNDNGLLHYEASIFQVKERIHNFLDSVGIH